jgi:hypothetical protein
VTHAIRQLNGAAIERDEERRRFRWALAGLAAVFTTIVLVACGGSDTNPVSPTVPATPAPPPAPRLIRQGSVPMDAPTDDAFHFFLIPITDAASGRWDATVDWSDEANTLWVWVADGVCSVDQFASDTCPFDAACPCRFVSRSESAKPKPRALTIPAAAGGTRTLIFANLGPGAETVQYRVTLTASNAATTSSAQTASVAPASTARKTRLPRK